MLASACSGQLSLFEGDLHPTCVTSADCGFSQVCSASENKCVASTGACSSRAPNGDCGRGQICSDGVCVCTNADLCNCNGACPSTWCDCAAGQGCDAGTCVNIIPSGPLANSCVPQRPDGLCADAAACCDGVCCAEADVCVGGACIPNDRPCSPSEPRGFCGQGLGCNSGRCEPLAQCACSPTRLQGCCEDGEVCSDGACVVRDCSGSTPGSCPAGQACDSGGCERIACLPGHLDGVCDTGYCSVVGACVPDGTCGAGGDCKSTQYCATDKHCATLDTCAVDGDCDLQLGQGYACTGGVCVERTSCTASAECKVGAYCSAQNHCLVQPKCDVSADCGAGGQFCAANHTCTTNGCCAVDADCGSAKICGERGTCDLCIDLGTCDVPSDCPPASACNTGTHACDPSGQSCDSNDFTNSCAPGVLSCCAPGGNCCPAGQRCSGVDRCIPLGKCLDAGDCVAGFACVDFTCVPPASNACPCAAGQHCATVRDATGADVTGCVADGSCAGLSDCRGGYRCDGEYSCQLDPQCGNEQLTVGSIVPPNVLIVFDRSGSMNLCGAGDPLFGDCGFNYSGPACNDTSSATTCIECTNGDNSTCNGLGQPAGVLECTLFGLDVPQTGRNVCSDNACTHNCLNPPTCSQFSTTPRWDEAVTAIKGDNGGGGLQGLIDTYLNQVAFGLSIFPDPDTASPASKTCATDCNWTSCNDRNNLTPGDVDVAIALNSRSAIEAKLNGSAPGGATPTAGTLRNILALPDLAGLNAADRADAVLLVTDGEPSGDVTPVSTCEPPCADGVRNAGETGVDCGGLCPPCLDVGGEACASGASCDSGVCVPGEGCAAPVCDVAEDCFSHLCRSGACRPSTCANELEDSNETDVDCGGACQPCADTLACIVDTDCTSQVCATGVCAGPSCTDGAKNGAEAGADCGGACAAGCIDGTACLASTDCSSAFCDPVTDLCKAAHCNNGLTDVGETAVDCGGACRACVTVCTNGVKDANEADIDCGGTSACPDCPGARTCATGADCLSGTCTTCGGSIIGADQYCRVNAAIDRLYAKDPHIKTFVVGFLISGSAALNCNVVHGKTANREVAGCDTLTKTTCDDVGAPTCYYDASNAAALQTALDEVIQQVTSCRFELDGTPPDPFGISVFLQEPGNPDIREPIFGGSNWRYDIDTNQIEFFGSVCSQVKAGGKIPIVIFGCFSPGG